MQMPGRFGNSGDSYRYGFSGKESDDEIKGIRNSYDFGARMQDPRVGRFLSIDKLASEYPGLSPYNYVANTPLSAIDPDGNWIIFVNGYYNTGKSSEFTPGPMRQIKEWIAKKQIGTKALVGYWNPKFVEGAENYFNDKKVSFVDGSGAFNSSGGNRFDAGYEYMKANFSDFKKEIFNDEGVQKEPIRIVSHSMGAAYSEGMIKYMEEQGVKVETAVHLSAADPSEFTASSKPNTIQLQWKADPVLLYKNMGEKPIIKNVDIFGVVDAPGEHWITKTRASVWDVVSDIQNLETTFGGVDRSNGENIPLYKANNMKYNSEFVIFRKGVSIMGGGNKSKKTLYATGKKDTYSPKKP